MPAMMTNRNEGQGSGRQDMLGGNSGSVHMVSDGMGHGYRVGGWQSNAVAGNQRSGDVAKSMVTNVDCAETTRSSSSDGQEGGEDSLWEH